jgi:hypothetical protein
MLRLASPHGRGLVSSLLPLLLLAGLTITISSQPLRYFQSFTPSSYHRQNCSLIHASTTTFAESTAITPIPIPHRYSYLQWVPLSHPNARNAQGVIKSSTGRYLRPPKNASISSPETPPPRSHWGNVLEASTPVPVPTGCRHSGVCEACFSGWLDPVVKADYFLPALHTGADTNPGQLARIPC